MEPGRESKRAPRKPRISSPKDSADAEAQMDDTPLIEKVNKRNFQALTTCCLSTSFTWNKRKEDCLHETQNLSDGINSEKESVEASPSDDEVLQGTTYNQMGAKKDELVMNICRIPRRARSFASRVSLASSRNSVASSQQRSPSPRNLDDHDGKLSEATKSRLIEDLESRGATEISEEEVDVALLLFNLSRSLARPVQSFCRQKPNRASKKGEFHRFSNTISSSGPLTYESKKKRKQMLEAQEDSLYAGSAKGIGTDTGCCASEPPFLAVDDIQVHEPCKPDMSNKLPQFGLDSREFIKESGFKNTQVDAVMENKETKTEERHQKARGSDDHQTHSGVQNCKQDIKCSSSLSLDKIELMGQISGKEDSGMTLHSGEKVPDEDGKNSLLNHWSLSRNSSGKLLCSENEKLKFNKEKVQQPRINQKSKVGNNDTGFDWEYTKAVRRGNGKQESTVLKESKLKNTLVPDIYKNQEGQPGISLPSTALSNANMSNSVSWMGAFPQQSYCEQGVPLCLTNCFHPASSSYPGLQFPLTKNGSGSVKQIRRCATHVYIAHFIRQQQQSLCRALVTPALSAGNLSSSMSSQEKGNSNKQIFALQSESKHLWDGSMGTGIPVSKGTSTVTKTELDIGGFLNSTNIYSVDTGIKKQYIDSKIAMTTAQDTGISPVCLSSRGSLNENTCSLTNTLELTQVPSHSYGLSHVPKCQPENSSKLCVNVSHLPSYNLQEQPKQLWEHRLQSTDIP